MKRKKENSNKSSLNVVIIIISCFLDISSGNQYGPEPQTETDEEPCKLGQWSPWGEIDCMTETASRTRELIDGDFRQCLSKLHEMKHAKIPTPIVSAWSEWGPANEEGMRKRSRTLKGKCADEILGPDFPTEETKYDPAPPKPKTFHKTNKIHNSQHVARHEKELKIKPFVPVKIEISGGKSKDESGESTADKQSKRSKVDLKTTEDGGKKPTEPQDNTKNSSRKIMHSRVSKLEQNLNVKPFNMKSLKLNSKVNPDQSEEKYRGSPNDPDMSEDRFDHISTTNNMKHDPFRKMISKIAQVYIKDENDKGSKNSSKKKVSFVKHNNNTIKIVHSVDKDGKSVYKKYLILHPKPLDYYFKIPSYRIYTKPLPHILKGEYKKSAVMNENDELISTTPKQTTASSFWEEGGFLDFHNEYNKWLSDHVSELNALSIPDNVDTSGFYGPNPATPDGSHGNSQQSQSLPGGTNGAYGSLPSNGSPINNPPSIGEPFGTGNVNLQSGQSYGSQPVGSVESFRPGGAYGNTAIHRTGNGQSYGNIPHNSQPDFSSSLHQGNRLASAPEGFNNLRPGSVSSSYGSQQSASPPGTYDMHNSASESGAYDSHQSFSPPAPYKGPQSASETAYDSHQQAAATGTYEGHQSVSASGTYDNHHPVSAPEAYGGHQSPEAYDIHQSVSVNGEYGGQRPVSLPEASATFNNRQPPNHAMTGQAYGSLPSSGGTNVDLSHAGSYGENPSITNNNGAYENNPLKPVESFGSNSAINSDHVTGSGELPNIDTQYENDKTGRKEYLKNYRDFGDIFSILSSDRHLNEQNSEHRETSNSEHHVIGNRETQLDPTNDNTKYS